MRNLLLYTLSKIHTKLLFLRNKNVSLGKDTVVFYKSHIVNKSKKGGGKNWKELSNRQVCKELSCRHAFLY